MFFYICLRLTIRTTYRDILTIKGTHDYLMACICTSMPDGMKKNLTERLVSCFKSNPLTARSTANDPLTVPYETLHFSWYNRHCTKVRPH